MPEAPAKSRAREWFGVTLLVGYISVVLLATMWPTPLDQGFESSIVKLLGVLHRNGVPVWFGYGKLEFTANVLMFVPLGFLICILMPAKMWWLALFLCPGLSIAIELMQATVLTARFATPIDVIANSTGALVGIFCAVFVRAIVYQRDEKVIALALWRHGVRQY